MEVKDIESQLHEQYAINNNSKLGTVVSFIVAMFAVFGAYGYVYFYTSPELPSRIELLTNDTPYKFTIWGTLFAAFAVYLVFLMILYICVYQGSMQRKEQFITFAIRYKAYGRSFLKKYEKVEDHLAFEYNKIFPEDYHPFRKKKTVFIQGLYGEFVKIICVCSFFIIPISIVIKLFTSDICVPNCCIISVVVLISTILFTIPFFLGIIVYLVKYVYFFLLPPICAVLKIFSIDFSENECCIGVVLSHNITILISLLLIVCFCGIISIFYILIIDNYYEKYKRKNNEYVDNLYLNEKFKIK